MKAESLIDKSAEFQTNLLMDIHNSKKLRSFKSKENIHKKEFGPYYGFGY